MVAQYSLAWCPALHKMPGPRNIHERIKEIKKYRILWVYGIRYTIHWKQIMSNCHYISCQEMRGGTTLVNIHCPFSPSAQICSQANWPHDITWSQATKCLQTLAKQIPTPQTKRTTLMTLMHMFDTLSSPGTLLFKKANKPCIVSHGGEHTLMSRRDEKMRLKWWICDMSLLFKEMGVSMCVLNQGPSPKTKHIEISCKFQNWILRLQSIHASAHANSTKQQAKTIKTLKTLLCESLHTLKSRSPAHTASDRSFAQTESQSLFPACCRTASVSWKL